MWRFAGTAAGIAVFRVFMTGCASTQHSLLHEGIAHYGAGRDNDDASHGYLMRGSIHASMRRLDLAEADLETSLELKPSKWHALAIREMKRYLLLAPEAADTRAAQDQIYKWEGLAK